MFEIFSDVCWFLSKVSADEDSAAFLVFHLKIFDVIYSLVFPIEKNLDDLPPSLFHLLANLCLSELSIILMVSQGFLKLVVENLKLLESQWTSVDETGRLHAEIATNLLIISRCANYHKPSIGSANDVIFSPASNVIDFCLQIVRVSDYSVQNPHYIQAIHALSRLSEDKARCILAISESDILKVLHADLQKCMEMSVDTAERYVKLAYNLAAGIRIQSFAFQLLTMREPLFLVARIHPSLLDSVKDTVWAITECHLSFESRKMGEKEDVVNNYLTAKEALELWELGIDVREKIRSSKETTSGLSNNIACSSVYVAPSSEVVEIVIGSASPSVQGQTAQAKKSAAKKLVDGLSFISRDSQTKMPAKLLSRTQLKGKILSKRVINPKKVIALDVNELPELRLTRPLSPMQSSTIAKVIV